jgi:hypothetical protein
MNTSATLASTQMVLAWTLLGVLLAWMFFCMFLALRPQGPRKLEAADLPTPSGAFPAILSHVPLRLATVAMPIDRSSGGASAVAPEPASDVGSIPIA